MAMDKAAIDAALVPVAPEETRRREARVRAGFWQTFRRAAGYLPFAEDVVALYYCALDPRTPARVRATLIAALAYFVLPFDVIPDFVIGLGFTDDIAVMMAALTAMRRHVKLRHRKAAREALAGQKSAA